MGEQEHIQKLKNIYAAFGRGDIPYILSQLPPNVKWVSHFDPVVPWAGDFTGHIQDFFLAIDETVEIESFEPGDFVAQGDIVVSLGYFGCKSKATGKSARTSWAFVWRFQDGNIVSYEQFHDPALALIFRN